MARGLQYVVIQYGLQLFKKFYIFIFATRAEP